MNDELKTAGFQFIVHRSSFIVHRFMHVVIVDTTMTTPPTGGAHTFLVDLCAPLAGRGWRASFVTQPGPEQGIVKGLREAGGEIKGRLWPATALPEERAEVLAAWVNDVRPDAYV